MPRRLKVFQTHIGFYDLVVAAPSMKAAAEAWRASTRLFAQGFAAVTQDPGAIEAALAAPGQVLKRPHGQKAPWKAEPDAPAAPRLTVSAKHKAAAAAKSRKRHEAEAKKRREAAERHARAAAKNELADIEAQEAALRARRQALRKKFHLRAVEKGA